MNRWNQAKIAAWDFEKGSESMLGVLEHLREEFGEFNEAIGTFKEASEAADIVILLTIYAEKRGFVLLDEVDKKMDINAARKWLPPNNDGVVKHDPKGDTK